MPRLLKARHYSLIGAALPMNPQRIRNAWLSGLAAIVAVGGAAGAYTWSMWASPAFGSLGDQAYHLHLAEEFERAWRDGDFPPRWAAGANGGRGSVAFVVYPPGFAFLTACVLRLGAPPVEALRLAALAATAGIVGSVFYLAGTWLSWRRCLLAAAAVLFMPANTFVALGRGMFPNFAALGWMALFLGAGQRAVLGRRVRLNAGLAVVAAAGLVLTHTLTAYLLALLLLLISPLLVRALGLRRIACAAAIAVAGAAVTCWFWLPLMHAGSYARVGHLAESHPYLDSVFDASIGAARDVFRQDWAFLNDLGRYIVVAQSLLALLLALTLGRGTVKTGLRVPDDPASADLLFLRALPWVAGLAFLAASEPGARLFLELPGAALTQFSWRWQVLVSLWCGVALASLPYHKHSAPAGVLGMAITVFFSPLLSPSPAQPTVQRDLSAVLTEAQFEELRPLARAAYAGNLLEHRPNLVDTDYYLPAAFGRTNLVSGAARVEARILKTAYREYRVASAAGAVVRVETYHAPGWSARLDSRAVEIRQALRSGLQLVRVPPGDHRLELEYKVPWP